MFRSAPPRSPEATDRNGLASRHEGTDTAAMRDKVQLEAKALDVDLDHLVAALRSIEEVEYAYLFGSRASGTARANSDLDLAIGLRDGQDLELLGDLQDRILGVLDPVVPGERMDLVVLTERTPVALRQQVFRHGRLLFARTRDNLVHLRVRTASEWCDGEPRRREAWAITARRLEERRWSTKK